MILSDLSYQQKSIIHSILKPMLALAFVLVLVIPAMAGPVEDAIKVPSVEDAIAILTAEDEYTDRLSPFDLQSKMEAEKGLKKLYLEFIGQQVLEISEEDKGVIMKAARLTDQALEDLGISVPLPEHINIIKTTLKEEGGAEAYTRGTSIMIKPDYFVGDFNEFLRLFRHELFHVISRNAPELRAKLYAEIGFTMCNEVPYPKPINDLKISNPDAPFNDSYVRLKHNGQTIKCTLILYAGKPYEGGSFFRYLKVGFLQVEKDDEGLYQPVVVKDVPTIYEFAEVEGFIEQVGRNTQYIINPEEILADNFALLLAGGKGVPDKELLDRIKSVLAE